MTTTPAAPSHTRPERVVSPRIDELRRLRTPLEPGERLVFELFNEVLAPEWEIYVQPHLNGLRPDFVLLHPHAGIAVFEVKDWDLSARDWRIEPHAGRLVLVGTDESGRRFTKPNPFERLHQYRREIAELYCPALNQRAGLASVTAGLIFPFSDEDELVARLRTGLERLAPDAASRRYFTLTGARSIRSRDLSRVFPDHARRSSRLMTPAVAADLRHWLVEPDFAAEQRERPPLSREQLGYVNRRTESGFRRLRGPAGSGKTMVVAGRASTIAGEGKDVLVVSYNITLLNYLRDCTVRFGPERNAITWFHFHGWCKRILSSCEGDDVWRSLPWDNPSIDELLARATLEAIDANPDVVDRFDAILVDEGQDFRPSWWNALRRTLQPGGEMLLVADRAQDIYGRNELWTEHAMEGAGFRGPWATLDASHRMPGKLIDLTALYIERFLSDGEISSPVAPDQQELDVDAVELRWLQTESDRLVDVSIEAIRASVATSNGGSSVSFADVVFICDRKDIGRAVVERLDELGVHAIHTFATDPKRERQQKLYFFKGDARVKATTIHSFKGWEGRHLVIATGGGKGQRARSALYTAMTRLKRHRDGSRLTVVCASDELEAFGRTWPQFELVG